MKAETCWCHVPLITLFILYSKCCGPRQLSRCSDWLRGGRSGDRIPVGEPDFPHLSRTTLGPTQPPIQWAPCLSRGFQRPGRGADHPFPSNAEVEERVELYLYSPSGPSWPLLGRTLPLFKYIIVIRKYKGDVVFWTHFWTHCQLYTKTPFWVAA